MIADKLKTIRVLYRTDTLALWGLPCAMRPGQHPRDLRSMNANEALQRRTEDCWIYLGSPGWWGSMTDANRVAVEAFLAEHRDSIPQGPEEWTEVPPK
jgi:hypothetical protein